MKITTLLLFIVCSLFMSVSLNYDTYVETEEIQEEEEEESEVLAA